MKVKIIVQKLLHHMDHVGGSRVLPNDTWEHPQSKVNLSSSSMDTIALTLNFLREE